MARVTRSSKSKETAEAETAAAALKIRTADIPIRSIENHDASTKETADQKQLQKKKKHKKPSINTRNRLNVYKKKKRQERVAAINASGIPNAEKRALRADIYKTFKTTADYERKTIELRQVAEAQKHEVAQLKNQLAQKTIGETSTPKAQARKRVRRGFL